MDNPYLNSYRQQLASENAARQPKPASVPLPQAAKPQQPGGLVGFLQNAGRSIGQSYDYLGKGLANVLNEATGGAEQERQNIQQSQQSDVAAIKTLGQKMRTTQDPQERQKLRNAIQKIGQQGNQVGQDFANRQNDIIEQNNPIKGAASVGSIGLDILGAGTGSAILGGGLKQAIAQGVKQGAVYGGAQGALQPLREKGAAATAEDIGANAASGAGIGALTGGAVGAAARVGNKLLNPATQSAASDISGKPSFIQRVGQRMTESGSGLKAEPTTGGIAKLNQQSEFMSKYVGTPRQQRIAMEKDMGNLSQQVDSILAKSPTPIKGSEVRTQVQAAINDPLKYSDVDLTLPGVQKNLQSHLAKFEGANTAKELNDYIKQLNPIAKRAQDKISRGVTLTDKEAGALTAKRAGDEVLSSIPEIKPLKQNMAQIFEVTPMVSKAAEAKVGVPFATGVSSKAPSQVVKGAQSRVGALLQGLGKSSKKIDQGALNTAFNPSPLENALRGTPSAILGASINPAVSRGAAAMQPDQAPATPETPSPATMTPDFSTSPETAGAANNQNDAIQQQLQQAAFDALSKGDTKGLDNITKVAGLISAAQKSSQATQGTGYGKPTAQQYALAQSGLQALGQLKSVLGSNPNIINSAAIPGQDLPIVGGLISNAAGTGQYHSLGQQIIDAISRARTGAAMTSSEEAFYKRMLPQPGDNPETIQTKLSALETAFQPFLPSSNTNNSIDLSNLIQ